MTRRALAGWRTWRGSVLRLVETRTDSRTRRVDVLEISQLEISQVLPASSGPAGHIAPVHIPPISGQSPLNLVQRWLGHAQLSTTADAAGAEERDIARRMWG
jgi:hypothetical protein